MTPLGAGPLREEYIFNLQAPSEQSERAEVLLEEARQAHPAMRWKRKTDRHGFARFFLRFPLTDARPDLAFQKWFQEHGGEGWELEGPTYGRWGFS